MALQTEVENAPRPEQLGPDTARERRLRVAAVSAYGVGLVAYWKIFGLPIDPVLIFLILWVGIAAWNAAAPWRDHLRFARDWAPLIVVIVAYSFSRGAADNLGFPLHVSEPITADVWLTGWFTDGRIPTLWLQEHLYTPGQVQWYDIVGTFVYFSHFVTAMIVAAVLWVRTHDAWAPFMRRFIALDVAGLMIYIVYPMAPPWWAAVNTDLIEAAPRIANRGWDALGLHAAGELVTKGQGVVNPVAAMPSLHAAFSMFVVLFFILRLRKTWTLLLLLYPLAMGFVLVYFSEHYVVDIFAGWAVTIGVFVAAAAGERWWRRQKNPPVPSLGGSDARATADR